MEKNSINQSNELHKAARKKASLKEFEKIYAEQSKDFLEWLNQQDLQGDTPLHIALKLHLSELAKFLIEKGAKINLKNNQGDTPFHLIVSLNSAALLGQLSRNPVYTPLIQALVSVSNNKGQLPIHRAIANSRNNNMVNTLLVLEDYASLTEVDHDFCTPLLVAAKSSQMFSIVEMLLQKLPVQHSYVCDKEGNFMIHLAVSSGYPETVELILKKYPKQVKLRNNANQTPLHIMSVLPEISGDLDLEKLHHALEKFDGKFSETVLKLKGYPEINLKINASFSVNKTKQNAILEILHEDYVGTLLCILETAKAENYLNELLSAQDEFGDTAMHAMVKAGRFFYLQILMHYGASLESQKNINGQTPLDIVVQNYGNKKNVKEVQQMYALLQTYIKSTLLLTNPLGAVRRIPIKATHLYNAQQVTSELNEKRKPIIYELIKRQNDFNTIYSKLLNTVHRQDCEQRWQRYKNVIPAILLAKHRSCHWPTVEVCRTDEAWAKNIMEKQNAPVSHFAKEKNLRLLQLQINKIKNQLAVLKGEYEQRIIEHETLSDCPDSFLLSLFENDEIMLDKFKRLSVKERKEQYQNNWLAEHRRDEDLLREMKQELQQGTENGERKKTDEYDKVADLLAKVNAKLKLLEGKLLFNIRTCPLQILQTLFDNNSALIAILKKHSVSEQNDYIKNLQNEMNTLSVEFEELKLLSRFAEETVKRIMDLENISILVGNLRGASELCKKMDIYRDFYRQLENEFLQLEQIKENAIQKKSSQIVNSELKSSDSSSSLAEEFIMLEDDLGSGSSTQFSDNSLSTSPSGLFSSQQSSSSSSSKDESFDASPKLNI